MKIKPVEKLIRADTLILIASIIASVLVIHYWHPDIHDSMDKMGLTSVLMKTIIVITMKVTLGVFLHRVTFYYARPHLFINTDADTPKECLLPGFWHAAWLRTVFVGLVLLAQI